MCVCLCGMHICVCVCTWMSVQTVVVLVTIITHSYVLYMQNFVLLTHTVACSHAYIHVYVRVCICSHVQGRGGYSCVSIYTCRVCAVHIMYTVQVIIVAHNV